MTILADAGVWLWGSATALLGIGVVWIIFTGKPPDLYERVKDSATALGAVVAASALAWSLFYQSSNDSPAQEQLKRIEAGVLEIRKAVSTIGNDK